MKITNFDDINLLPNYSEVNSRDDVSLETCIGNVKLSHGIIPSNMSTICGYEMAKYMLDTGGVGFIHRGNTIKERCDIVTQLKTAEPKYFVKNYNQYRERIAVSVGCKTPEQALNETKQIVNAGSNHVVIDVAHGRSWRVVQAIQLIKQWNPNIVVTAGNVADYPGFKTLWVAGADVIKVGVSGGSVCGTNRVTGFGCPTLTSLLLIQQGLYLDCTLPKVNNRMLPIPSIIADGGIRSSGDMIKCFLLGKVQAVCIGGLLAGTDLTPGPILDEFGDIYRSSGICKSTGYMYKSYHGMSSHKARREDFNDDRDTIASEGQETIVKYKGKGSTIQVMNELLGGLRSGLSYLGVHSLSETYMVNYIER